MRKFSFLVSLVLTFALSTIGAMAAGWTLDEQPSADTQVKNKIIRAAEHIQKEDCAANGLSLTRFAQWYNWNNWNSWHNWRNW